MPQGFSHNEFEESASVRPPKSLRTSARALGVAVAATLMASSVAHAALDIGVNVNFQGTPPHSSTTPWVNSLFTDISPNTVQLTITAPNLTNPEFFSSLYLQFNPTKNVSALTFTPVFSQWQGISQKYSVGLNQNNFQAGANGGDFSILLGFNNFSQGDQVVFDITTSQKNTSLSSADFAFRSSNNHHGTQNTYYEAAYIQGIGGNGSGWDGASTFVMTAVPEPASGFAAAGCCLVGLAMGAPKRVKKALCGIA